MKKNCLFSFFLNLLENSFVQKKRSFRSFEQFKINTNEKNILIWWKGGEVAVRLGNKRCPNPFFSKCFTWDTPERLVEKILMGRNGFQGSRVVLEQRRRYPSFAKVRIIKYIKKEDSEGGGKGR